MDYHSDDSSDPDTPEGFKSACSKRADSLCAVDVMTILHEKVAFLSGGRDPRGGPLLTFPQCERREKLKHTDYRPLLHYLTRIPCSDVRDLGFTVIVDMRGSTWGTVKPVLKELHLTFAHTIHIVYIIKPDNFWQKQRTSLGSQKYKFETSLMSVGALCKTVDPSQLTTDFDGSLPYDHNTWIEIRLSVEEFTASTNKMLAQLESLRTEVSSSEFAEDVTGAKTAVEKHKQLQAKISGPALNDLHAMGHRLLQRLQSDECSPGGYTREGSLSLVLSNADLQSCVPNVVRSLSSVEACVAHVQQTWQSKKHRLEQCMQLRMLEQDVEKMLDWLYHNREEFLVSYVEIGHTCHIAKHLQETHSQFTVACQKVYLNLNKILSVASHLIDSGHYEAQHIASLAQKLEQVWKEFAAGLDERSSVLALSVMFHQKAEQYIESVAGWLESCNVSGMSNDIHSLENNIHLHQQLYDTMCQAYTEVHSTSKKLLYQLDHLVQICSQLRRDAPQRSKHKKPRGKPSAYSVSPDGKVVFRGNQATGAAVGGSSSSASSSSSTSQQTAPPPPGSKAVNNSPASDYSEGASHVLAVIHEILAHHRAVEQRWTTKKLKMHQRLALRLFQEDVKQVIEWIATHGEVFLQKNPGVGRNLAKIRMYQKSHEHFEMVAQNTYTNAEKLLQAAEELAHTGECNAQEIYNVAQQLDSHITSFVGRVHQRRRLLQLAVMFHTHQGELVTWLREVVAESANDDVRGLSTIESVEEALTTLQTQQEATEDACANTSLEGQSLLRDLRDMGVTKEDGCGSIEGAEEALSQLAKEQTAIQTVWTARRIKLDLLQQLRLFQRDAMQVLESVEECARDSLGGDTLNIDGMDQCQAEELLMIHNENLAGVQQGALNTLRRGQEIVQLLKTSGLDLECYSSGEDDQTAADDSVVQTTTTTGGNETPTNSGGEDSSGAGSAVGSIVSSVGSSVSSSKHNISSTGTSNTRSSSTTQGQSLVTTTMGGGSDKVSNLVELLHAANVRLESLSHDKQSKLEQVIHLCHFMELAQTVLRWIHSGEKMLSASYSVPNSLAEAQSISQDHQQFQVAIEKTHESVVQLRERSAQLHHCNSQQLIDMQNTVAKRWENLVTCAEDRYKLVQASISFYKTAEQVCSVLESLERDYKRDDDWCSKEVLPGCDNPPSGVDKATALRLKIEKHQEQKESFLRACTLARKTAQTFLKYANRSQMYYRVEEGMWVPETKVRSILDDLMVKENNVLECWTEKKRTLDQCAQYITLENNARLALDWILQTGETYLETHTSLGDTKEHTEQLLKEHTMFKVTAKDTRENVKMILQLADKLVENGHKHANSIREWVTRVDHAYKKFSVRMDQYRMKLEGRLGICSEESKASLALDRHSDPTLEHKLAKGDMNATVAKSEMSEEKRRSSRKKELIMKELLDTERTYVKDLEICVSCYLKETLQHTAPKALQGKEQIIFCNMEEILNFHKNTFLLVLEKYKAMPEDVGHCFVTYAPKFDIYVSYCKAQPESNKLLVNHAGNFYDEVQRRLCIEHPIPAYLIKPVQRITKYQLLLKELLACCEQDNPGEIKEGLEVMQNVPKKANDVLHLSMLEGCDIPIDKLGDVILQDSFQVWDPRQLLRKHRERHVFLFEHHVVFCKEVKDQSSAGSSGSFSHGGLTNKYQYKQRLVTSELGLSEHSEGDECKFSLWGGSRNGAHDSKMILRASSVEVKQTWVKRLRQVMQDSYLSTHLAKTQSTSNISTASSSSSKSTTNSPGMTPRSVVSATASVIAATAAAGVRPAAVEEKMVAVSRKAPLHGAVYSTNNRLSSDYLPIGQSSRPPSDRVSLSSFSSISEHSDRVGGGSDYGWVTDDFIASTPGELSVSRGQYLEILEPPHHHQYSSSSSSSNSSRGGTKSGDASSTSSGVSSMYSASSLIHSAAPRDPNDWVFVRVTTTFGGPSPPVRRSSSGLSKASSTEDDSTSEDPVKQHVIEEGYVPLTLLKMSKLSLENVESNYNDSGSAKRKPFPSRKWFPPQLRKFSGGASSPNQSVRGTSNQHSGPSSVPPPMQQPYALDNRTLHLSKVGCVSRDMGNKMTSHIQDTASAVTCSTEEGDLMLDVELPPPMNILEEPLSVAAASAGDNLPPGSPAPHTSSSSCLGPPPSGSVIGGAVTSHHVIGALVPGAINSRGSCVSLASASEPSTAHLAYEIENIVKEKMEQHEGHSGGVLSPPFPSPPSSISSPPPFNYPGESSQLNSSPDDPHQSNIEKKLGYVVKELVDTEINYVKDLALVVEGYMVAMNSDKEENRMPEDLVDGKDKIVFGNIAAIYEWHRDYFSKNLEECPASHDKIAPAFIRSEKKFQIYIKYCQNKPKSEYIVSEFYDYFEEIKQRLGHKLQLSDLLIKPVQRLMKYQLLMRDLHKYSARAGYGERASALERAIHIMTVLPRDADHMMTVGRLQDFEGNIMAQGKLLHYGPLLVSEGDTTAPYRPRELVVFLFEQRIIFSECQKKRNAFSSDEYYCKNHLQMNKLSLEERCDAADPNKFLLKSTDPRKVGVSFVCQGENMDDHHTWTSQIRRLLQTQRDFLMALQSPIAYQKEQTKHLIDEQLAWEPIGLMGRRISTTVPLESLAPAPRLPLEKLLNVPEVPLSDCPPITVMSPIKAPPPTSSIARSSGNLTTVKTTASDSSLYSESSFPPTSHRWSAGEVPQSASPTSVFYQPMPVYYPPDTSSHPPASPPKNRRKMLDTFKMSLRPKSRMDGTEQIHSVGSSVSVTAGTLVQTLQAYTAHKEDEISVQRGEEVQVVSCSNRGYLIHRAATHQSPASEGWVPACVIQPPTPSPVSPLPPSFNFGGNNNPNSPPLASLPRQQTSKKSWIKFRKPSFSKREAKAAAAMRDRHDNNNSSDRNSTESGSFGDYSSITNSSDISISDRLSGDYNTLSRSVVRDEQNDCVMVGDGGDDLLQLVSPLRHVTISPGEPLGLSLKVSGVGAQGASVSWFGPNGELDCDTRFELQHLRDGTVGLHLANCTPADAGRYTCVVTSVCSVATRQISCSAEVTLVN